ncbi:MAG TPA: CDP-alcohol phosphatidyltransferase family protein [Verrucomicrobiae bacterium]|nr:CDP-alcohol phosphatidyltransferase family protein [Verrucomicrobiae bacterium]
METRRDTRSTHFSMLRSYRAADLLSLGNAASGTAAIFAIMSYLEQPDRWRVYLALGLLPLALALDIADGRVARLQNKHSLFGGELDSLADIVSFGVAPAALAYALGMRGGLDVAILLFFVACGISRLARYNVTAAEIAAAGEKVKHFEGTPIPSSLILILILALCFHWRRVDADLPFGVIKIISFDWHPLSLMYLLSGAGMISKTLRIPKL